MKNTTTKAKPYDWTAARAYNANKRKAATTGTPRAAMNGNG